MEKLIDDLLSINRWSTKTIQQIQKRIDEMGATAAALQKLQTENEALTKELGLANAHIAKITPDVLDATDKAEIAKVNAVTIVPPKAVIPG